MRAREQLQLPDGSYCLNVDINLICSSVIFKQLGVLAIFVFLGSIDSESRLGVFLTHFKNGKRLLGAFPKFPSSPYSLLPFSHPLTTKLLMRMNSYFNIYGQRPWGGGEDTLESDTSTEG